MPEIIVIADDLTGAAEIASLAYHFGLSVTVRMIEGLHEDIDDDVLVVNTDTRNLQRDSVINRIDQVFRLIHLVKNQLIFKKTDSLLRGWIETEISSILGNTDYSSAILIPANPSRNRIIRAAKYFVNGKPIDATEFSLDPEYPRDHSDVLELIQDRTEKTIAGSINRNNKEGEIEIPDISSRDDIGVIIKRRVNSSTLFCGGADLFRELLLHWKTSRKEIIQPVVGRLPKKVFILGSRNGENRYASSNLKGEQYTVHPLTTQLLEDEQKYNSWKAQITMQQASPGGRILACPQERITDASGIDGITDKLVDLGAAFTAIGEDPIHFFITGGETASRFCKRLGWSSFSVLPGTENGVVMLSIENSKHLLTIKPGSYSWPKEILKTDR